ncbi:hypothetical protein L5515_015582 [Caenorhabditis briggsae]|uniref:BHLH domain-containing protein n=1 Tax=Caenorhabditis briggsae TaxID=6238 RepID=A0AAE9EHN3_CAEBR|nr:hypothetical protein L5515_015582 [Caenorhabditis briggsae]
MTLSAEEIANQKRVLKNQREKQHYQNINKELEKLGKIQSFFCQMAATPLEGEELESQLRRNQRERNRLHTLNSAYHELKKKILHMVPKPTRRVSKVKILQYAIQRIRELQGMLPAETEEDRMRKKEKIKRRRKRIFERKFLPLIKEREEKDGQRKEHLPNFTLCPSSDPSTNYQNDPYFQPTPPEEMSLMESDESDEKLYNSSSFSHDNLLFSY